MGPRIGLNMFKPLVMIYDASSLVQVVLKPYFPPPQTQEQVFRTLLEEALIQVV